VPPVRVAPGNIPSRRWVQSRNKRPESTGYNYLRPGIETIFSDARCVQVTDPFDNRVRFNEDSKAARK